MMGHEQVKAAVRDYLQAWVPIRLELIRQMLDVTGPEDPNSYRIADYLPDNDPALYPALMVTSTRTLSMSRRQATGHGDIAVYDIDYEVTVVVAAQYADFKDEETAVAHRDRLLLAVRECVLLPAALNDTTHILATIPDEVTGAAAQTLRGAPLAAGQITFAVRSTEALMPTVTLAQIVGGDVDVRATDANGSVMAWTYAEADQPYGATWNYDGSIPE